MTNVGKLISVKDYGEIILIRFEKERILDQTNVDQFSRELEEALGAPRTSRAVLDFSGVEYVTSAVIAKLTSLHGRMRKEGGMFKLCCMYPTIREIFRIMKLDKLFEIFDTLEEAVASFQQI